MVTSVSFAVLFSGACLEDFNPSRGIRQGDPLKSRMQSSVLKGIKVAPSVPTVNHLLFADDSLLLCKANMENAMEIKDVCNSTVKLQANK
jgi:hypothetical protein